MIMHRRKLLTQMAIVWDVLANALAFYIAYKIKLQFLPESMRGLVVGEDLFISLMLIFPIYYFWGKRFRVFNFQKTTRLFNVLFTVFKSVSFTIISLTVIFFFLKLQTVSRLLVFMYGGMAILLVFLDKIILLQVVYYFRRKGFYDRNILVVGSGRKAREFIQAVEAHNIWGMRIVGMIDKNQKLKGQEKYGHRILGTDRELKRILLNNPIDEVVCAVPFTQMANLQEILYACEELGITMHLVSNFFNMIIAKTETERLNGLPLLTFSSTPHNYFSLAFKHSFDFVFSALMLVVFSPFFLLISLLIKATSRGPVFFIQERCGLNGRRFRMLKFRTMVLNAEELKVALAGMNEMSGPVFKIKNDPRVTPIGKFLRKTSFDEFPQFINVLKGEMSVVGPRPPVPSEVEKYEYWQRRRLSMRPGITCLWQISGRNEINFDDWMKLDLQYIDNWHLWLDFKIILKTLPVVFLGRGAY